VNIRLKANVTMPDLQISNDAIEFYEVRCGECKIITVQLNNHKEVRCDWFAAYLPKKDEKFTPMHLKRKKKADGEANKPRIYEIMPPSGILMPGQKANIQIKFMPTEEVKKQKGISLNNVCLINCLLEETL
jgi:hydrocephalus-inducing protein